MAFRQLLRQAKTAALQRLVQLYAPTDFPTIHPWIQRRIHQDFQRLLEIKSTPDVLSLPQQTYQRLTFEAGQLLYSLDEGIRQGARDKLIAWFYPMLPSYWDDEKNSQAQMVLLTVATNYDVYLYWQKGEEGIPNFSHYLTRSLKFVPHRVFWQRVPPMLRNQISGMGRIEEEYRARNGVMPTAEVLGEAMGKSAEEVLGLKEARNLYFAHSLDAGWEEEVELGRTIAGPGGVEEALLEEQEGEWIGEQEYEEEEYDIEERNLSPVTQADRQWRLNVRREVQMFSQRALSAAL